MAILGVEQMGRMLHDGLVSILLADGIGCILLAIGVYLVRSKKSSLILLVPMLPIALAVLIFLIGTTLTVTGWDPAPQSEIKNGIQR